MLSIASTHLVESQELAHLDKRHALSPRPSRHEGKEMRQIHTVAGDQMVVTTNHEREPSKEQDPPTSAIAHGVRPVTLLDVSAPNAPSRPGRLGLIGPIHPYFRPGVAVSSGNLRISVVDVSPVQRGKTGHTGHQRTSPGQIHDIFEDAEQIQQLVISRAISGMRIE